MFQWFWQNIEQLNALSTIIALVGGGLAWLGTWALRVILTDRKMAMQLIADVQTIKNIVAPEGKAPINNVIADIRQQQNNAADLMAVVTRRVSGMVARQRAMLSDDIDPMFETDALTGAIVFANQAYLDLVGRSLEQIKGRGWETTIHTEERAVVVREWDAAVLSRRIYEGEFRIRTRAGNLFKVKCVLKPMVCEADVITGYLGRYSQVVEVH